MKRRILLSLVALFFATTLTAKPVSVEQARKAAETFLQSVSRTSVGSLTDLSSHLPFNEFYTFALEDGGFVLVSGDDCVLPILAYSLSQPFGYKSMPEHVQLWLQDYEDQIAFYRQLETSQTGSLLQAAPSGQRDEGSLVARQWHDLLAGNGGAGPSKTIVGPLLSTTWNQSPYYNNSCPYDSYESDYAVAGCVAIAMSQVMKYHNYPTTGYGSHSYTHSDFGTLSANFGSTTYAWSSMPNSLSSTSTTTQVNAVATLVYHVGVAVEMDYSVESSGALSIAYGDATTPSAENALRNYFKYSPALHSVHMEDYSASEWAAMLMDELDDSRPILYSGRDSTGGHAFVCDGYNSSTGKFHFNWGWGGYCDGYYTIGSLNPTPGGTGGNSTYTFNLSNTAIIGIEPNNSFSSTGNTTVTVTTNNSTYGSVTGGGSKSFGTTASLKATANSGYRFVQWDDGYRYNPREFVVNGGSLSFEAEFEPLSGDTLSYCDNNHQLTALGYGTTGSDVYWGIKLPASALSSGQTLNKVQLYATEAGTYTLNVYVGSTSSTAYTANYTVSASNADAWNTFTLSTPLTLTGTQPVWITFATSTAAYPAAMTYSSGNNDALLWGSDFSSLGSSWDNSFMIRGIFGSGTTPQPTSGDTLTYVADSTLATTIGAGGTLYWGVSFPPAMLTNHNYLEKVLLYVSNAGSYTLNVYSGNDTLPTTLQYTKSYTFTSSETGYQECVIDTLLAINQSQHLWVTFYNTGVNYPAAGCNYVNNAKSNWVSTDGTSWYALNDISDLEYSWLIQCVTSQTMPAAMLTVNGPTQLTTGTSATFTATVSQAGYTVTWSLQGATPSTATGTTATATWNTAGTYNVIATATQGSTQLKDTLVVSVTACNTVTTFPFTMGFESTEPLTCWTMLDEDEDGWGWMLNSEYSSGYSAHTGSNCLISASYENNTGVLYPDNWAITPAISLPSGSSPTLSWYDAGQDINYISDQYSVYAATSISALSTATALFTTTLTDTSWTQRSVSLGAFAGQTVYIAFRHHNSSDMYWVKIDDINLSLSSASSYSMSVTCTGSGSGTVTSTAGSLCGTTSTVSAGAQMSLTFTPTSGSTVEHIYVNNNDMLGNATSLGSGAYSLSLTISTNTTINAVFGDGTTPQPGSGDTLTYVADSAFASSVGAGGTLYWGVSFPPAMLTGHNYLEKVLLYVPNPGTYSLSVSTGSTTAPSTLQYTKSYTFTSSTAGYQECVIDTLLAINQSQHLWVTFYNSGVSYPAAACSYMGDAKSNWVSLDGTSWSALNDISDLDYSWLIQCITSQTAPEATLTINGPTYIKFGTSATYTAMVSHPGFTVTWNLQGATPSTATGTTATVTWLSSGFHNVIATATSGSTVLTDTLVVEVFECNTITSFPYTMGFEEDEMFECWLLSDNDLDGWGWMTNTSYDNNYQARTGNSCLMSASYENNTGVLTPDNWAYTPAINLPAGATVTLTWYDAAQDVNYASDHYSVYVSNSLMDITTSTALFSTTLTTDSWTQRTLDLSAFAGQIIYIGFRHHNCSDMYWLKIDDISLTVTGVNYYTTSVTCAGGGSGNVVYTGTTGSLCGMNETVAGGTTIGFDFIPDDGSTVEHIYVNNSDMLSSAVDYGNGSYGLALTINGNTNINAIFGSQGTTSYYVTAVSADETMGYVIGGGSYVAGATATIEAKAYNGYAFDHWNDNVTTNPRSFTVTADVSYTAYFKAVGEGVESADGINVSLYPNPATESVTVKVSGLAGTVSLTLVDAMGREVMRQQLDGQQAAGTLLDVSKLTRGVYFLRLVDANGLGTVRKLTVR